VDLDVARRADPDADDVFAGIDECGFNDANNRGHDCIERAVHDVQLVLFLNSPVLGNDRGGHVRAAQIDAYCRAHRWSVWHRHRRDPQRAEVLAVMETIDLTTLRNYSRRTGQATHPELLDARAIEHVKEIEIDEEHITVTFDQKITRFYNANEIVQREWVYKYNEDPEFVGAIGKVIDLARKHLKDMPDNVACPPGCAECCSGYEPFVSRADVQRIADHLKMPYDDVMREYVIERPSADGYHVGWLRKVSDDIADNCVFLKGSRSGHYYCGIYPARPDDCRDFTPIGCEDVDESLPRNTKFKIGPAFQPKRRNRNGRPR
jgi:Fe-S-cluster containining protein